MKMADWDREKEKEGEGMRLIEQYGGRAGVSEEGSARFPGVRDLRGPEKAAPLRHQCERGRRTRGRGCAVLSETSRRWRSRGLPDRHGYHSCGRDLHGSGSRYLPRDCAGARCLLP